VLRALTVHCHDPLAVKEEEEKCDCAMRAVKSIIICQVDNAFCEASSSKINLGKSTIIVLLGRGLSWLWRTEMWKSLRNPFQTLSRELQRWSKLGVNITTNDPKFTVLGDVMDTSSCDPKRKILETHISDICGQGLGNCQVKFPHPGDGGLDAARKGFLRSGCGQDAGCGRDAAGICTLSVSGETNFRTRGSQKRGSKAAGMGLGCPICTLDCGTGDGMRSG